MVDSYHGRQNEVVKCDQTGACHEHNGHMCVDAGIYLTQPSCVRYIPLLLGPRVFRLCHICKPR